jgi:hypothetical protein
VSFEELARVAQYPPGRELVVRELCRALYDGGAEDLCIGARKALAYARSLVPAVEADTRARLLALDAGCVADELLRMARMVRAGVARG